MTLEEEERLQAENVRLRKGVYEALSALVTGREMAQWEFVERAETYLRSAIAPSKRFSPSQPKKALLATTSKEEAFRKIHELRSVPPPASPDDAPKDNDE